MEDPSGIDDFMARKNLTGERTVWQNNHPKIDYILNKSKKYLSGARRATEVGIGDGHLLKQLSALGMHCTGLDISAFLIDYHRRHLESPGGQIDFVRQDIADDGPLNLDPQDAVFCMDILEHLEEEQFYKSIDNIHRLLRKNGLLIGSFPYDENLAAGMVCCPNCRHEFHRVGHRHAIDIQKLRRSLMDRFAMIAFGNVLRPYKTFLSAHLKDLMAGKLRKYVPGGTIYFIARKISPSVND